MIFWFDYSLAHWAGFFVTAILLNLSPGPDFAYIIGHTIGGGKRAGFAAMFGIWTGAFGHVLMAAVGLSAILVSSAVAFTIVKWIGALYLIWLGINAMRSKGHALAHPNSSKNENLSAIYKQGALVGLLNPKVAMFFLAFLPQFVVVGAGPVPAQLFLHGVLIIAVAGLVEPILVIVGDRLANLLQKNKKIGVWVDRSIGTLFIALGLRLAIERQ